MTDTQRLKASCDLRRLVEQDLGQPLARGGRAFLWKCPFHHEKRGLSLAVWADGYFCFGKCDRGGDALDWLQRYRRLSFTEAVQLLGAPFEPDQSLTGLPLTWAARRQTPFGRKLPSG